jgi:predicted N-formylglutamate amidohydrolase
MRRRDNMEGGFRSKMSDSHRIFGADRPGPWVVCCDHASNRVPDEVGGGSLGLPPEDMARHIAWDIGAAGVGVALADLLDAPAVLSCFSRLVIDPNRGEDDPTLLMKIYDGTVIPANRNAGVAERELRLARYWRPYRAAVADQLQRPGAILVSMHSYNRQLAGRAPRPWQVGLLSAHDRRLSDPLLELMATDAGFLRFVERVSGAPLCLGDNEPYPGYLPGDVVDAMALTHGRPNTLVELRNDLIETPDQQRAWAAELAPLFHRAAEIAGLLPLPAVGSRT